MLVSAVILGTGAAWFVGLPLLGLVTTPQLSTEFTYAILVVILAAAVVAVRNRYMESLSKREEQPLQLVANVAQINDRITTRIGVLQDERKDYLDRKTESANSIMGMLVKISEQLTLMTGLKELSGGRGAGPSYTLRKKIDEGAGAAISQRVFGQTASDADPEDQG